MSFMRQAEAWRGSNSSSSNKTTTTTTKTTTPRLGDVLPSLEGWTISDDVVTSSGSGQQQQPTSEKASGSDRVLVTSGSAVVGYRVAMSLLKAGYPNVRVGIDTGRGETSVFEVCAPQCQEVLLANGAEVVDFDWTNSEGTIKRGNCFCSSSFGKLLI